MRNLTLSAFGELTTTRRRAVLSDLVRTLGGRYRLARSDKFDAPALEHAETGVQFRLILGGRFAFGLSEREEMAARKIQDPPPLNLGELRPPLATSVKAFLISASPILV